jgi:hypothetical protein
MTDSCLRISWSLEGGEVHALIPHARHGHHRGLLDRSVLLSLLVSSRRSETESVINQWAKSERALWIEMALLNGKGVQGTVILTSRAVQ